MDNELKNILPKSWRLTLHQPQLPPAVFSKDCTISRDSHILASNLLFRFTHPTCTLRYQSSQGARGELTVLHTAWESAWGWVYLQQFGFWAVEAVSNRGNNAFPGQALRCSTASPRIKDSATSSLLKVLLKVTAINVWTPHSSMRQEVFQKVEVSDALLRFESVTTDCIMCVNKFNKCFLG